METAIKPQFPLQIVWLETGEAESFEDAQDLICNLEDFDSTDPKAAAEARVTDALGRPVHLLVEIWKDRCEFRLVDKQVEISSLGKEPACSSGRSR